MSNLSVFSFKGERVVRVQVVGGEPWFCLRDVCEVLSIKNSRDLMAKQLDRAGVDKIYIRSGGQQRQLQFVNEPNLYRVIFRSNKPEARQFQDWVFNEVLPEIRKTGSYRHAAAAPAREPITGEQSRELTFIVGQIANQFHFKRAWVAGIWHAIRRSTGSSSPAPLTVDDLPAVQRELRRIVAVTEQMKAVNDTIERDVLRLAIRGRQPAYSVLGKVGQYGRDNPFSTELPAKLEIMIEGLSSQPLKISQNNQRSF